MIKHVGKQGDRKVAIVFREVPGEEHMCLVVYPDVMPMHMHDSLMKAIESTEGQSAENLGDALHSKLFNDGRPMLMALHSEGMLKKVQTGTVTVTPATNSHVRLDELNSILREMKTGEDAIRRMAELDADRGYTGKAKRRDDYGREVGAPSETVQRGAQTVAGSDADLAQRARAQAPQNAALDDSSIADNLKLQAERMAAEAKGLLAESERMIQEANSLLGITDAPKRGRKPKAKVADAAKG
jgi:hypothetical protein